MEKSKFSSTIKPQDFGYLSVPTANGFSLVLIKIITHLNSNDQMCTIFFENKSKLDAYKHLLKLQEQLQTYGFLRVHNKHLVNIAQIKEYIRADNGYIKLLNGTIIPVSREARGELLVFFRGISNE
jgi:two-component system, LytTR family, response regulator